MSSVDSYDLRRPSKPWRIAIVIAAVACLGLTMCVGSEQKRAPAKPAAQPATQAQEPAPPPPQSAQPPAPKPDYFPATKAPGGMYR
jgi:hypothetical protein